VTRLEDPPAGLGRSRLARLRPGRLRPGRLWLAAGRWISAHAVVLAGLGLIAGQLGWTAALLAHSYFRQGDFVLLHAARREGLGWKYLMAVDAGHLTPAGQAIVWVLARISLYSWPATSAAIMIGAGTASLAMLRMLLTVFTRPDSGAQRGARAGILVPLAVYLFCPLSVGAVAWLSEARWVLPLQFAMFLAVDAHVRFLRGGRLRHLLAATVWLAVDMAAADQGALVPVLLFALTVAYFAPGRLRDATAWALTRHWRAWVTYGTLLGGYCVVFFVQLASSGVHLAGPGKATSLYEFAGAMIGISALPGMAGGPWQWVASGYAQAGPPPAIEYLSWAVVAIVVLASCVFRVRAWRAWVILLGWILAADVMPAAIGGFRLYARALGAETGYLADATGVLALCLGLAFLPAGEAVRETPRAVRVLAMAGFCCFVAGTVVSLQAFVSVSDAGAIRSYLATARLAVADVPHGTLILDGPTPATVLDPGFFPGAAATELLIGPLARRGALTWTQQLDGVLVRPLTFDATGRLRSVVVAGVSSLPPRVKSAPRGKRAIAACWSVTSAGADRSIPLDGTLYRWSWTARLEYSGPAGVLWLSIGDGESRQVLLPAGQHVVYVPLVGSGNLLNAQFLASGSASGQQALCVTGVTVGLVYPDPRGLAIPARPVPG
jgi:hypothetical protein